jgi:hypothetical protein
MGRKRNRIESGVSSNPMLAQGLYWDADHFISTVILIFNHHSLAPFLGICFSGTRAFYRRHLDFFQNPDVFEPYKKSWPTKCHFISHQLSPPISISAPAFSVHQIAMKGWLTWFSELGTTLLTALYCFVVLHDVRSTERWSSSTWRLGGFRLGAVGCWMLKWDTVYIYRYM